MTASVNFSNRLPSYVILIVNGTKSIVQSDDIATISSVKDFKFVYGYNVYKFIGTVPSGQSLFSIIVNDYYTPPTPGSSTSDSLILNLSDGKAYSFTSGTVTSTNPKEGKITDFFKITGKDSLSIFDSLQAMLPTTPFMWIVYILSYIITVIIVFAITRKVYKK
jgi:hypothetical protein